MVVKLILAEKPDQQRSIAAALGTVEKKGYVLIIKDSKYLSGELHIVAARGHLVETNIQPPKWTMDNFPWFPEFSYSIKKGDEDIKKRFATIKSEVKIADEIILSTDADREGERIGYTILNLIPNGIKKLRYRAWINSTTAKGLRDSFTNLKNASETINFYYEAEARSQADYLIGYNMSPIITLHSQNNGTLKKGALSVGRVQSAIVKIVIDNDREIENFVPEDYWKLSLSDQEENINFVNEEKYFEQSEAENIFSTLTGIAEVENIEVERKSQSSKKLFDLDSLQKYASKKWGYSPEDVLTAAQELYQEPLGLLTYPRTGISYITPEHFEILKENLEVSKARVGIEFKNTNMSPRSKYVNEKKVKEHFAIMPTDVIATAEEIENFLVVEEISPIVMAEQKWDIKKRKAYQNEIELAKRIAPIKKDIYLAVLKRVALMFAPDYVYDETVVRVRDGESLFYVTGNKIIDMGFQVFEDTEKKDNILPDFTQGQKITVKPEIKQDTTRAPARITESTMIGSIMKVKYKIGTPATRASILRVVQDKGYIKKNQKKELFPLEKGINLINAMTGSQFIDPETTGKWEKILKLIGQGKVQMNDFVNVVQEELVKEIRKFKGVGE
ncbi:type IA DNA topoisomerase [Pseudolactococcus yaeyamensis]